MIQLDMSEIQRWGGLLESEAQAIGQRIETAVAAQQAVVVARAAAVAPARTGTLRGTIRPLGSGLIRRVRAGSGKAYYAPFQEFGTRKMSANPFLLIQANRAARAEFEGRVQSALGKGGIYA